MRPVSPTHTHTQTYTKTRVLLGVMSAICAHKYCPNCCTCARYESTYLGRTCPTEIHETCIVNDQGNITSVPDFIVWIRKFMRATHKTASRFDFVAASAMSPTSDIILVWLIKYAFVRAHVHVRMRILCTTHTCYNVIGRVHGGNAARYVSRSSVLACLTAFRRRLGFDGILPALCMLSMSDLCVKMLLQYDVI